MKRVLVILLMLSIVAGASSQKQFLKEGHRGCRGLMPENTIPAMKKGLDLGVDVLELDLVISKDKKVVVSHDAVMNSEISLNPSGDTISKAEQKKLILYGMSYAEIRKYDVGSKHHHEFPQQQNLPAYKPLFAELIDSTDAYARQKGLKPPSYNVEIKSNPTTDGINQPPPQEFVDLVVGICKSKDLFGRMNIQSFDPRPLQLIHKQYPDIELSYLTMNFKSVEENLTTLGFKPNIYSPNYKTVTKESVKYCHDNGIKIIPWTINTKEEIEAIRNLGVDGIISDYPNRL